MYICPVCGSRNSTGCCAKCGFDESRNYERYPTPATLSEPPEAISRRTAAMTAYFRCSACGSFQFMADMQKGQLVCATCGQATDASAVFHSCLTQTPPEKKENGHGGTVSREGRVFTDETNRKEDPSAEQLRQAHEHWSGSAPKTPAKVTTGDMDWRKSEAACRAWQKSQEEQKK